MLPESIQFRIQHAVPQVAADLWATASSADLRFSFFCFCNHVLMSTGFWVCDFVFVSLCVCVFVFVCLCFWVCGFVVLCLWVCVFVCVCLCVSVVSLRDCTIVCLCVRGCGSGCSCGCCLWLVACGLWLVVVVGCVAVACDLWLVALWLWLVACGCGL
jgi:hypothetical protein